MTDGRGAGTPHRVPFSQGMFDRARSPQDLAATFLEAGPPRIAGGRHEDLGEHLSMLAGEFSGQSLLAFRQAWLTVLIRREIDLDAALNEFRALWDDHAELLSGVLDLRWLISAADTLMLHPRNEGERMAALAATLAGNLVKMAETERLSLGVTGEPTPGPTVEDHLFDGLRAFRVCGGDMLHNLLSRVGEARGPGAGHAVLDAVVRRLVAGDSVVRRMTLTHAKPKFRPAFRERTVAIFNDTAGDRHFGCMGVMSAIDGMVASRGSRVVFRHRTGEEWQDDPAARQAIRDADLVIVNGEGSIHHSRPRARDLAAIGPACREAGTRAALINATLEENDHAILHDLATFETIWVRESASAAELARHGIAYRICPDLTLSLPERTRSGRRAGQLFFDSVTGSAKPALARWAAGQSQPLLVMKRHPRWKRMLGISPRRLRAMQGKALPEPRASWRCADQDDFRRIAAGAAGITTGRFHALCYAILERTPFLAVRSNTAKIEATLADAGLGSARLLEASGEWRAPPPFDADEVGAIELYLQRARAARDRMAYDLLG